MTLGDRIRRARRLRGWSQGQLAEALKRLDGSTTQGKVSGWERGVEPRPAAIENLAAALQTTPEWLLTGAGDSPTGAGDADADMARVLAELDALRGRVDRLESDRAERSAALEEIRRLVQRRGG